VARALRALEPEDDALGRPRGFAAAIADAIDGSAGALHAQPAQALDASARGWAAQAALDAGAARALNSWDTAAAPGLTFFAAARASAAYRALAGPLEAFAAGALALGAGVAGVRSIFPAPPPPPPPLPPYVAEEDSEEELEGEWGDGGQEGAFEDAFRPPSPIPV